MTNSLGTIQVREHESDHEKYLCCLVFSMAQRGSEAEQSLSVLYDLTVSRVVATIGRFLPDRDLVAELTQDAFFQVWNQAHLFDKERGCVLAWLLTIARSRALDARRCRNAQAIVFDSEVADAMLEMVETNEPTGADILQSSQEQRILQNATLALTPTTRHILALAFFSGLSHSEISTQMQLPLGTIKSTLRRGLVSMSIELERVAPGIGLRFGL